MNTKSTVDKAVDMLYRAINGDMVGMNHLIKNWTGLDKVGFFYARWIGRTVAYIVRWKLR